MWYTTNEKGERITTSDYSEASKHQTILGKLSPDFYGGFSTNLSWKNIDLSAVFGYSVGGEIYNYDRSMYDSDGAYVNYNQMNLRDDWNRWENRAISLPIQKLNMVIRANPARDLPVTWRMRAIYVCVA